MKNNHKFFLYPTASLKGLFITFLTITETAVVGIVEVKIKMLISGKKKKKKKKKEKKKEKKKRLLYKTKRRKESKTRPYFKTHIAFSGCIYYEYNIDGGTHYSFTLVVISQGK